MGKPENKKKTKSKKWKTILKVLSYSKNSRKKSENKKKKKNRSEIGKIHQKKLCCGKNLELENTRRKNEIKKSEKKNKKK